MKIAPLTATFGAIVDDLDFAAPLSDDDAAQLRALWLEHGMVLVRGRNTTPQSQIAFSKLFGPLEAHPLKTIRSGEFPELMELDSSDRRTNPVARWHGKEVCGRLGWHKDLIYTGKPNRGAVLRAVHIPAQDGETGYADQAAAYDALDDATKAHIADMKVVYGFEVDLYKMPYLDTSAYEAGPGAPKKPADVGFPDFPDSVYPLVLVHPETGRKVLNVCPMFLKRIDGLPEAESDALLRQLVAHVTEPRFCYLHSWQTGNMILWDNWRYMHSAPGVVPGARRLIHRTTIMGDEQLGTPQ